MLYNTTLDSLRHSPPHDVTRYPNAEEWELGDREGKFVKEVTVSYMPLTTRIHRRTGIIQQMGESQLFGRFTAVRHYWL